MLNLPALSQGIMQIWELLLGGWRTFHLVSTIYAPAISCVNFKSHMSIALMSGLLLKACLSAKAKQAVSLQILLDQLPAPKALTFEVAVEHKSGLMCLNQADLWVSAGSKASFIPIF